MPSQSYRVEIACLDYGTAVAIQRRLPHLFIHFSPQCWIFYGEVADLSDIPSWVEIVFTEVPERD